MRMIRRNKEIPATMIDKFTDALDLFVECDGFVIKLSTGQMDPSDLTLDDKKKHGAFYVSWQQMKVAGQNKNKASPLVVFYDKKTDGSKSKTNIGFFDRAQEFCERYIGPDMEPGQTISAEMMNVQKRPYNKLQDVFTKAAVIPHGAVYARVPKEFYEAYTALDQLCEAVRAEGFVVVDRTTGNRFKLKREYFGSTDPEKVGKQRGSHESSPSKQSGSFTDVGAEFCCGTEGEEFGYCNAPLTQMVRDIGDEIGIAELCDDQVELVSRSVRDTIAAQVANPFSGQKMLNHFITSGAGDTYQYQQKTTDPEIHKHDLEFQLKLDGETVLIHKDGDGNVHLMLKFQVDAYVLQKEDPVCRMGWI